MVCGHPEATSDPSSGEAACPWFAKATDFEELRQQTAAIAAAIASHTKGHSGGVTLACSPPVWTLSGLVLALPALLWWLWLHFWFRPPALPSQRQDPLRLRAAGANERSV